MILRSPRASAPVKTLRSTRTAFTLLEVLVVVAIIVMLAGVGGYYVMQQYESAKVSKARIDCAGLSGLVEQYRLAHNQPPASIQALAETQPDGSPPLMGLEKAIDPWNKPYQLDPTGPRNNGMKADVFTITPRGITVGNWKD